MQPEKIKNASSAALGLATWLRAQVMYKEILLKVNPLRQKIKEMNEENEKLEGDIIHLEKTIKELEVNIEHY